jgi:hypothetical protein
VLHAEILINNVSLLDVYLFIYGPLKVAVSSSDYMQPTYKLLKYMFEIKTHLL